MNTTDFRAEIYDIVSRIEPVDLLEQEHIDFVCSWIESGSELCRLVAPATPAIHLVSYCLILTQARDQILLVDHKKSGLWLPSGGHVEPDEHPKNTARREAKEELGIEAQFASDEPLFLTVAKTVGSGICHQDVSLWYVLYEDPKHTFEYDPKEFHKVRWFSLDAVPFDFSDPHLRRCLQKIKGMLDG